MQKVAVQTLSAFRSTVTLLLKPFGKTSRTIINTFLYSFIRPIWNRLPDLSNYTYTATLGGSRIKFRPLVLHDFLFVLASASKSHEPLVQKVFQPKQGQVVIDVGAHIGIYTVQASRDVGQDGLVVAVEPDPQSFRILQDNIALNHLGNIRAVNAALSDVAGQRTFYAATDPSLSGFQLQPEARLRKANLVQTLTLDELTRKLGLIRVDWVKLDVEGSELKVLQGGKAFLGAAENLRVIVESSDSRAVGYLRSLGFDTRYLGEIYYLATKISANNQRGLTNHKPM